MPNWIYSMLDFVFVVFVCFTVFYSFRYRRQSEPVSKGLNAARMNISMGIMLVDIALIQYVSAGGALHFIIGTVFMLLGLYNLFAGIRNYSHFRARSKPDAE